MTTPNGQDDRYRHETAKIIGTARSIGGRLARVTESSSPTTPPREAVQRWRLTVARAALDPDQAQRSQQGAWEAALTASGLPIAGLDAPKPRARHAHAAPLSASIPGDAELVDLWLVDRLPRWRVREALEHVLPAGHTLVDLQDVWLGEAALPGRVTSSVYRATLADDVPPELVRAAAVGLLAAVTLPRERRKGDAAIPYDLRPFLEDIVVGTGDAGDVIRLILRHDPEKGVGRPDEVMAALADALGRPVEVSGMVRERLVLGDPPATDDSPKPRGPRGRGVQKSRSFGGR